MTVAESAAPLNLVFQALADPTRRIMLERLTLGPASVQHLQLLEASGLVRSEKVGRVRTCHIETAALRNAEHWIGERRTTWERRFDRLGEITACTPEPSSSAPESASE